MIAREAKVKIAMEIFFTCFFRVRNFSLPWFQWKFLNSFLRKNDRHFGLVFSFSFSFLFFWRWEIESSFLDSALISKWCLDCWIRKYLFVAITRTFKISNRYLPSPIYLTLSTDLTIWASQKDGKSETGKNFYRHFFSKSPNFLDFSFDFSVYNTPL